MPRVELQQSSVILSDTIVAVSSAPGWSDRALVRVSGSGAGTVLRALAEDGATSCAPARGLEPVRLRLHARESAGSLPALAAFMRGPNSYTGEDTLEIQVPGNPHVVERVVAAFIAGGARTAEPGEFSARAYLAGRLTLTQAEGVAATIAARTREQLEAAGALLAGTTGSRYKVLADECASLLALVEAGIDFTDQEDVVAITAEALCRRVGVVLAGIAAHLGSVGGREAEGVLPRVALLGAPNAGKSTLFNTLLGRTRAIASPTPGTTRDALEEELDLSADAPGAGRIMLIDVAGLDAALAERTRVDALAIDAARAALERSDALLWCDATGEFDVRGIERVVPGIFGNSTRPVLRVRTFADRAWRNAPTPIPGGTAIARSREAIPVCALDGWNLAPLRRAIAGAACSASAGAIAALIPRHRLALGVASERLAAALALATPDLASGRLKAPETVADALRAALDALGELVGELSPDDVLGRVFATFCIGK